MALSKIGTEAVEHISSSANATYLTIDASEQITVSSEGGAVTTSLQQGVSKSWCMQNAGTSITDSLNVASLADYGTGDHAKNFTNAMSSGNYSVTGSTVKGAGGPSGTNYAVVTMGEGNSTTNAGICCVANGGASGPSASDRSKIYTTVHGDLA